MNIITILFDVSDPAAAFQAVLGLLPEIGWSTSEPQLCNWQLLTLVSATSGEWDGPGVSVTAEGGDIMLGYVASKGVVVITAAAFVMEDTQARFRALGGNLASTILILFEQMEATAALAFADLDTESAWEILEGSRSATQSEIDVNLLAAIGDTPLVAVATAAGSSWVADPPSAGMNDSRLYFGL